MVDRRAGYLHSTHALSKTKLDLSKGSFDGWNEDSQI
jgi:hypothetical protein